MNRKALAAEFLGTFGLVFAFVGVNCAGAAGGNPAVTLALGYGLAYMVFSAGVFHVSGGHLNPAVTFAALLTGRLQVHEALAYVAAQCVGAVAAAALMVHALPPEMLSA